MARRTRGVAAMVIAASVGLSLDRPVSAQGTTSIPGLVASQPTVPAKIKSCSALVSGSSFTADVEFDPTASVKSSTVTFSFFDKANAPLGQIALTPPYVSHASPAGLANFTCAVTKEMLADGTIFPAAATANNTALVIGGLVGVGLIAALASHGGSGETPAMQTPTTPPTSTAAPVVTPTPSPTPSPSPSVTPTASPTATTTATATAMPSPTVAPTATPTTTATAKPTIAPTATATPTVAPTATPTVAPTATPTVAPSATPTVAPTATPTVNPSAPVLSNNPLNISGTGNTATTTVSEANYNGTFSTSTDCGSGGSPQPNQTAGPIAMLSGSSPYADPSTITVTANEAGSCAATFTDANGLSVSLSINVTTTSITVNGKKPVAVPRKNPTAPTPVPGTTPALTPSRR